MTTWDGYFLREYQIIRRAYPPKRGLVVTRLCVDTATMSTEDRRDT